MKFRTFRGRILFFLLGLVALVQGGVLLAVDLANALNARRIIDQALEVTAHQFQTRIEDRSRQLTVAARLLSGDFAFKKVFATHDSPTIRSALENQRLRIGADALVLISVDDGRVISDTLRPPGELDQRPFGNLIGKAEDSDEGEAAAVVQVEGESFNMVSVPLLAPLPVAWIVVGFRIDDGFAEALKRDTLSEVSLLWKSNDGQWTDYASTLPVLVRAPLPETLSEIPRTLDQSFSLTLLGDEYVTLITELDRREDATFTAILQRSQEAALAPYYRLRIILFALTFVALCVSLYLGHIIARSVSKPVQVLAEFTEKVRKGDYTQAVEITQVDEIGRLSQNFNRMVEGLREREFIRETFGKYIPESVAAEILRDHSALAPQLRMATVLFTDLQDFTSICERMSPPNVISMLNEYFSLLVGVIDSHGGVVNQFQGDAMLVTYNLPVADPDHAISALNTAIEIEKCLKGHTFGCGLQLVTRIGINSGNVVAGSVGAGDRLSYTVHGDTVNLAARLESLNKEFGTRILVSEATRKLAGGRFQFDEIGEIPIRGRSSTVPVFSLPVD